MGLKDSGGISVTVVVKKTYTPKYFPLGNFSMPEFELLDCEGPVALIIIST